MPGGPSRTLQSLRLGLGAMLLLGLLGCAAVWWTFWRGDPNAAGVALSGLGLGAVSVLCPFLVRVRQGALAAVAGVLAAFMAWTMTWALALTPAVALAGIGLAVTEAWRLRARGGSPAAAPAA